MENVDEFMRRKFNEPAVDDDSRFEFKEEYWNQAEALIKQDERRRKAAIWWWRTGVAMALCLLLLLWRTCSQYSIEPNATPSEQQQVQTQQHPQTNRQMPNAPFTIHPDQPSGKRLTPSDTVLANRLEQHPANEKPTYPGPKTHPNYSARPNAAHQQPPLSKPYNPNPTTSTTTPVTPEETSNAPHAPAAADQAPAAALSPYPVRAESLDPLDLPFPEPVLGKIYPTPNPVPNPVDSTEKPNTPRAWIWHAQAGVTTYPNISPDWSFHAGAGVTRSIKGPWSWTAGLNGRVQHFNQNLLPNLDSSAFHSTAVRYSFGFECTETRLKPYEAYWLESSVGLGWQYKFLRLGAGLSPGMLLTLTGKETQTQISSFTAANAPNVVEKTVRLNPEDFGFRRFYLSTFVNVQARMTPHLHLYTQANWCPQSLQKTTPFTGARQKTWFDFGVQWQFNPQK
jgi:hypothetical protein